MTKEICGILMIVDAKWLLKLAPDFYKSNPDFLGRKGKKKSSRCMTNLGRKIWRLSKRLA